MTVFFATLVVVIDGAEAPFIFMTTCLQAVAYLVTVLQAGLTGDGISRCARVSSRSTSLPP